MAERQIIDPGENPYLYGQSLPMVPPAQPPITEMDHRKVGPPPLFRVRPPQGAPTVVIVLMDQSCYADPEMFGGRIRTPTLERLAANGVTDPNFKVNAACAPTLTALLTGRNSHQNSMATVTGYNWLARAKYEIESAEPLPTGAVSLVFDFDYDGGGPHKGATGSLIVNGRKIAEGRIDKTMGALYSLAAEPADIGHDSYSPVTDDYPAWDNAFTGTIKKVTVRHKDVQPAERTDCPDGWCGPNWAATAHHRLRRRDRSIRGR